MKVGVRIPPVGREMGLGRFCQWLAENGFGAIDLPDLTPELKRDVEASGLQIGTVDVMGHVKDTLSAEEKQRAQGVTALKDDLSRLSSQGANLAFCVLVPKDPTLGRQANFDIWKETWPEILTHAENVGIRFAIEWWPGPAPYYPALGCTPEMWRKMFQVSSSPALTMCYDPSHLARIQIDWMRALDELGDRIVHVHAKDTEILPERLYEQGILGASL